jgi:hypothetical protein
MTAAGRRLAGVRLAPVLVAAGLALAAGEAWAHKPSDSYLVLRPADGAIEGHWDIALVDLDAALGLDADGDGALTWGELRRRERELTTWARGHLGLRTAGGACAPASGGALSGGLAGALSIVRHSDGAYARLPLAFAGCAGPGPLVVDYRLFFARDPQHRCIVDVEGAAPATAVLSAEAPRRAFALAAAGAPAGRTSLWGFVREGVVHIWGGLDHVLFLMALLLPAVLRRRPPPGEGAAARGAWTPVAALRPAVVDVARVVTAFTLAHSLTLALAALGVVHAASRIVEPAIAASVALAAVNNVRPLLGGGDARWGMAFALGLLHGFGFSSVLADVGLPPGRLLPALLGFNLGVELGQLALVALFLPLAYLCRRTVHYRRLALTGGSLAIAALALVWLVERAFAVSLIS